MVSLRARIKANWPAVSKILPAWFDPIEDSFSYKDCQFKKFCLLMKTSFSPENVNETSGYAFVFLKSLLAVQLACKQ